MLEMVYLLFSCFECTSVICIKVLGLGEVSWEITDESGAILASLGLFHTGSSI